MGKQDSVQRLTLLVPWFGLLRVCCVQAPLLVRCLTLHALLIVEDDMQGAYSSCFCPHSSAYCCPHSSALHNDRCAILPHKQRLRSSPSHQS
ncbi:hypothetical protein COO60DRAFT_390680 [Scenedesmus sp. NREL 46B-D3]|nr:hypothetical protein COO60DRAFT_390680 [Scenedesmus sp. NREL 46B-D3]